MSNLTKQQLIDLFASSQSAFTNLGITGISIFGSYKLDQNSAKDIDILVILNNDKKSYLDGRAARTFLNRLKKNLDPCILTSNEFTRLSRLPFTLAYAANQNKEMVYPIVPN